MDGDFRVELRDLSRDSVNQLNKIFDRIAKRLLPSGNGTGAAPPSVPVSVPGTASFVNNTQTPLIGPQAPMVNEKPGNSGPSSNPGISSVSTDGTTIGGDGVVTPIFLKTPVAVASGGTGTATPALVAGLDIKITGSWPNNTIAFFVKPTNTATTPYAVAASDGFVGGSATIGADQVVTLPAATGTGRLLYVKKMDANAHNVVLTPAGADTIDGAATYLLTTQYQAVAVLDSASAVWSIVGSYP